MGYEVGFLGELRSEEEEEFVCSAQIACQEVGEHAARAVERGGMRLVGFVPGVLERGEGCGAVLGSEDEVALCVVGFEFC